MAIKKVKAWAVLAEDRFLFSTFNRKGADEQATVLMLTTRFNPEVVPCTISFTIPTKKRT